jgi:oligopeptide/dipeptide ABC transporter ATP-binding protein
LLRVKCLTKKFPIWKGLIIKKKISSINAVNKVSFNIKKGETLGLVGESGCGKTTTGRCIMRLIEPTSGEIYFNDLNISNIDRYKLKQLKRSIQMIFQDPFSSLNPRMIIGKIIEEPLIVHHLMSKQKAKKEVFKFLDLVGLNSNYYYRFPHEFSSGQRQRIGIARSLILNPELIIADEPVSALDVSIQSQILNLMKELKRKFSLTYLFIAHNLNVVYQMSDRIAVMYLGRIVEIANVDIIYEKPLHPYTQTLINSIPSLDPSFKKLNKSFVQGSISDYITSQGCSFKFRCQYKKTICDRKAPKLIQVGKDHFVACHQAKNSH